MRRRTWRLRTSGAAVDGADLKDFLATSLRRIGVGDADPEAVAQRLRWNVHPAVYLAQCSSEERAALGAAPSVDAVVAHWVRHGAAAGRRVGALFQPWWYADRLGDPRLGEGLTGPELFLHWLWAGWRERVVPTPLFDEQHYRARHADVGASEWGFAHFLRAGCYSPRRDPGPFGRNYGSVAQPHARERRAPVLLATFLRDADHFDLRSTSWLEEAVLAMGRKARRLESPRMRDLVAKASAIQPLVSTYDGPRWSSWPTRSHPALIATEAIEQVRHDIFQHVGGAAVATVLLGPAYTATSAAVARELRRVEPDSRVLVIGTDGTPSEGVPDPHVSYVDVSTAYQMVQESHRPTALLDVIRGLAPRRVVSLESRLGWQVISAYGNALHRETSLAAAAAEETFEPGDFEQCFDMLDWVLLGSERLRTILLDRYMFTTEVAQRLIADPRSIPAALSLPGRQERA